MCYEDMNQLCCKGRSILTTTSLSYGDLEKELNCTSHNTEPLDNLNKLQWSIYEVTLPVLIATGVLANVVDLIILSRPSMKGVSYRYLARLALSDLLYLLLNIPFCFDDFLQISKGYPVSNISAIYYAHVAVPIVNTLLTMSVYIVVWLSYDRCIAVCSPHKFSSIQRLNVVHLRCGGSLILTLIIYVPFLIRQTYVCGVHGCCVYDSEVLTTRWYTIYELVRELYSRFIPAIAITWFNVRIIVTLKQLNHARAERPDIMNEARQERERRLVLLLLAITVLFYISTLPSALYKIIRNTSSGFFPYLRAVADVLEVSGHVFNFVLYFLFSPDFRKTLISLQSTHHHVPAISSAVGHA